MFVDLAMKVQRVTGDIVRYSKYNLKHNRHRKSTSDNLLISPNEVSTFHLSKRIRQNKKHDFQ